MKGCVVVPAYEAAGSVGAVVAELAAELGGDVLVVDDGSRDATSAEARKAGARVARHETNRGKGAAIATGLADAAARGFDVALTVDADGQHPARSARLVLEGSSDPGALVLGVRDLVRAGAPRANRFSNGVSNFFLSRFARRALTDTQCGLRRYPIAKTLALGVRAEGYAFEAEVLLRAARGGVPIVEVPVEVVYPPENERVTHFHSARDPAKIIVAVLRTLAELRGRG